MEAAFGRIEQAEGIKPGIAGADSLGAITFNVAKNAGDQGLAFGGGGAKGDALGAGKSLVVGIAQPGDMQHGPTWKSRINGGSPVRMAGRIIKGAAPADLEPAHRGIEVGHFGKQLRRNILAGNDKTRMPAVADQQNRLFRLGGLGQQAERGKQGYGGFHWYFSQSIFVFSLLLDCGKRRRLPRAKMLD